MKGTAIHIDEIYTDVTIEKLENKSTGVENTPIDNYKELFQILDSSSKIKQKKTKGSSREQFNARAKIVDSKPKQEGQKFSSRATQVLEKPHYRRKWQTTGQSVHLLHLLLCSLFP